MNTIGTFTAQNGSFVGNVRTLTLNINVKIVPTEKQNDNAPDYRVLAGDIEIGTAWKRTSKAAEPRAYLSVTMDDASFPSTLYASLFDAGDGTHNLIWSRSRAD